jgi:hypothetical protein
MTNPDIKKLQHWLRRNERLLDHGAIAREADVEIRELRVLIDGGEPKKETAERLIAAARRLKFD